MERCPVWGKGWWKGNDPSVLGVLMLVSFCREEERKLKSVCVRNAMSDMATHYCVSFKGQRAEGSGRGRSETGAKPKKLSAVIVKVEKKV